MDQKLNLNFGVTQVVNESKETTKSNLKKLKYARVKSTTILANAQAIIDSRGENHRRKEKDKARRVVAEQKIVLKALQGEIDSETSHLAQLNSALADYKRERNQLLAKEDQEAREKEAAQAAADEAADETANEAYLWQRDQGVAVDYDESDSDY